MSTAFFTAGRLALLEALQDDSTLTAAVRTWFDWGPGLRRRHDVSPALCPAVSVAPAALEPELITNVIQAVPQELEVRIVTDGQDAAPCEELVQAALDVLAGAAQTRLGLADQGLSTVEVRHVGWRAVPDEKDPRVRWEALINVRLHWFRN